MRPAHSAREILPPAMSATTRLPRFNEARAFSAGNLHPNACQGSAETVLQ